MKIPQGLKYCKTIELKEARVFSIPDIISQHSKSQFPPTKYQDGLNDIEPTSSPSLRDSKASTPRKLDALLEAWFDTR